MIDQVQRLLYLAEVEEARRFLAAHWPRYDAPVEYTEAELARLLEDGWQETCLPADWGERLAETVRLSRANYTLMVPWLEQQRAGERWEAKQGRRREFSRPSAAVEAHEAGVSLLETLRSQTIKKDALVFDLKR